MQTQTRVQLIGHNFLNLSQWSEGDAASLLGDILYDFTNDFFVLYWTQVPMASKNCFVGRPDKFVLQFISIISDWSL